MACTYKTGQFQNRPMSNQSWYFTVIQVWLWPSWLPWTKWMTVLVNDIPVTRETSTSKNQAFFFFFNKWFTITKMINLFVFLKLLIFLVTIITITNQTVLTVFFHINKSYWHMQQFCLQLILLFSYTILSSLLCGIDKVIRGQITVFVLQNYCRVVLQGDPKCMKYERKLCKSYIKHRLILEKVLVSETVVFTPFWQMSAFCSYIISLKSW